MRKWKIYPMLDNSRPAKKWPQGTLGVSVRVRSRKPSLLTNKLRLSYTLPEGDQPGLSGRKAYLQESGYKKR